MLLKMVILCILDLMFKNKPIKKTQFQNWVFLCKVDFNTRLR
jgi:hypothetical protein